MGNNKIQLKKHLHLVEKIENLVKFLHFLKSSAHDFVQIPLTNKLRELKLPEELIQLLKERNIILFKGSNSGGGTRYKWNNKIEINEDVAEELYLSCRKKINEYTLRKKQEKSSTTPVTLSIGQRKFVKVLPGTTFKKDFQKEEKLTLTEEKISNCLNFLKRKTQEVHSPLNLLNFETFCSKNHLSPLYQFSIIHNNCLVKDIKGYYHWNPAVEITIKLVRKIIEDRKLAVLAHNLPEVKFIGDILQFSEPVQENIQVQKKEKRSGQSTIQNYYNFLIELYENSIKNAENTREYYIKKYRIHRASLILLKKKNLIASKEHGFCSYTGEKPTIEVAETLLKEINLYIKPNSKKITIASTENIKSQPFIEFTKDKKVLVEKEKSQPLNQNALKKDIALKLIKLGELEQANILLGEII